MSDLPGPPQEIPPHIELGGAGHHETPSTSFGGVTASETSMTVSQDPLGTAYETPMTVTSVSALGELAAGQATVPETPPADDTQAPKEGSALGRGKRSNVQGELQIFEDTLRKEGIDAGKYLSPEQQDILPDVLADKTLSDIARSRGLAVQTVWSRVQVIARRLAEHPDLKGYVPEGLRDQLDKLRARGEKEVKRYYAPPNPYARTIREAKAAEDAQNPGGRRRWATGQTANIIRTLTEKGFDVVGRIPISQPQERAVVALIAQGLLPKAIAKALDVHVVRVKQFSVHAVDIVRFVVPPEELPPLEPGFLEPQGSLPRQPIDESSMGGRLTKMAWSSRVSYKAIAAQMGVTEEVLRGVLNNDRLPQPQVVETLVRVVGGDEAIVAEYTQYRQEHYYNRLGKQG